MGKSVPEQGPHVVLSEGGLLRALKGSVSAKPTLEISLFLWSCFLFTFDLGCRGNKCCQELRNISLLKNVNMRQAGKKRDVPAAWLLHPAVSHAVLVRP